MSKTTSGKNTAPFAPRVKRPFDKYSIKNMEMPEEGVKDPTDLRHSLNQDPIKRIEEVPPMSPATSESTSSPKAPLTSEETSLEEKEAENLEFHALIPLTKIRENPLLQPRLRVDEAHVATLAERFQAHGQLNPIIVRPIDDSPDTDYEIIGGNHRYRAALQLGWKSIRCNVLRVSFEKAQILSIDDNDSNLPTSDYERSLSYSRLLESKVAKTHNDLAELLGIARSRVTQCLSFTHLPDEIKEILNDSPNLFSYRTALELRDFFNQHADESGAPKKDAVLAVVEGLGRVKEKKASLASLIPRVNQKLSRKPINTQKEEPMIVLNDKGRVAFKLKKKDSNLIIECSKDTQETSEELQQALLEFLKEFSKDSDSLPSSSEIPPLES